jgi:hypothetical protein
MGFSNGCLYALQKGTRVHGATFGQTWIDSWNHAEATGYIDGF